MKPCVLCVLEFVLILSTGAFSQTLTSRPITVDDYFQVKEVADPQISADGGWIAYTVETARLKEDKNETRIWMVPSAGGDAVPMTAEGNSSTHPRWSPDGKYLAFLSARNQGKTQIWLLDRRGGEAQKLTDTIQDVSDFAWSPDSQRLVLVLKDPSADEKEDANTKRDPDDSGGKKKEEHQPRPIVVDRYHFKEDEVGYLDRRRNHLYVFEIAGKGTTQITSGDYDDENPAWSPDGKRIAFNSNRTLPDPDRTPDSNIWVVSADNTDKGAHLTQVTTNPGEDESPSWSPDGKWIAYITQLDPKLYLYATHHIAVSPALGGEAKVLTGAFDRMSSQPRFTPDGKDIYFIADDDGTQNLCSVPAAGGEVTRIIGGRLMLYDYSMSKSGEIAAQITTPDVPSEIFTVPGGQITRVSHTNDDFMKQVRLVVPEYIKFKSHDGTMVTGYLYKPLDYTSGKKYPTLLRPHGGPVWSYYAEYFHLAQLMAANGYVVLLPNPRGSTGQGQAYAYAIQADWGNKDFQDDMAIVDYAIAQGFADPDKLGVFGWSYGGISTDFIIAQTHRFKAAISGAGASLFTSLYGHDPYTRDYDYELGHPWEKANRPTWDKLSMFYRVSDITTPVMFMGGDVDWNVPILGGEQMYQALKALGRETELVVYPGEYHQFKAPSHIKDRLERDLSWFAHYVKADGTPARPVEKKGD